jgi:hypothetical protein
MKYRVRKGCVLTYPDGTLRGERGYVVDGDDWKESRTIIEQGDVLERISERQTPASPRDLDRLTSSASVEEAEPITADEPAEEQPKPKKKRKSILRRKKKEGDE